MSTPALTKVAKLIPLLASERDGEVIATAHAIRRTLHAAGMDFHGLASALTAASRPKSEFSAATTCSATFTAPDVDLDEIMRRANENARRERAAAEEAMRRSPKGVAERITWCLNRSAYLAPDDRSFLWSVAPHSKSRGKVRLRPNQKERLDDIATQLEGLDWRAA